MTRPPGLSVRLKLALSYAGFLVLAGVVLLMAGYFSLSRGFHPGVVFMVRSHGELLRSFAPTAALVLGFLVVFGLVGGWILAGRMLSPLNQITEATRKAAAGSLSHRIRLAGPTDEFRELADAFDAMLARLEAQLAEQQRFAANASHELRTPLAVSQTLLEVARKEPTRDPAELVERLYAVNARAIDLTEALLLLSRAEQRAFTPTYVDLSLLAEDATETLLPLAEKRGITVQSTGQVATAPGSQPLLLQLTSNLLHNAIVHNLPADGAVWLTTRADRDAAVLTVENTGETLTPRLVATLTEPFQRGTARVHADHAGVGLGLAIVARIVQAHDGVLTLEPRPGGGLRVTVRLPAGRNAGTVPGWSP